MPFAIEQAGDHLTLELSGEITARHVAELAARLSAAVTADSAVVVRAGGLEDIDTSVLQCLVALRKTVRGFRVENTAEALVRAADRCALRRELLADDRESI